jgi:hypothetical protein
MSAGRKRQSETAGEQQQPERARAKLGEELEPERQRQRWEPAVTVAVAEPAAQPRGPEEEEEEEEEVREDEPAAEELTGERDGSRPVRSVVIVCCAAGKRAKLYELARNEGNGPEYDLLVRRGRRFVESGARIFDKDDGVWREVSRRRGSRVHSLLQNVVGGSEGEDALFNSMYLPVINRVEGTFVFDCIESVGK